MSEKELIWVPKEIAEKYKNIESIEQHSEMILELIKRKKKDFAIENENLDDDVLTFKAVCLRHKAELQKVYNEQSEQLELLWKDCSNMSEKINEHARKIASDLSPIVNTVRELKNSITDVKARLADVSFYPSSQFVQVAEAVSRMDDATKILLRDVLNAQHM